SDVASEVTKEPESTLDARWNPSPGVSGARLDMPIVSTQLMTELTAFGCLGGRKNYTTNTKVLRGKRGQSLPYGLDVVLGYLVASAAEKFRRSGRPDSGRW